MFKRSGAIVFLAVLYLIAAKIGSGFSQVLTVFSILIWTVAAGLFVYLVLFRGVRLSFLQKAEPAAPAAEPAADNDPADENATEGGEVLPFPNSAS